MSQTLTKEKLSEKIQSQLNFSSTDARDYLELLLEQIKLELENGKDVKVSGFGKWSVRIKKKRPGRNPHTGSKIEISSRSVVTFHPSDKLRSAINSSRKNMSA